MYVPMVFLRHITLYVICSHVFYVNLIIPVQVYTYAPLLCTNRYSCTAKEKKNINTLFFSLVFVFAELPPLDPVRT